MTACPAVPVSLQQGPFQRPFELCHGGACLPASAFQGAAVPSVYELWHLEPAHRCPLFSLQGTWEPREELEGSTEGKEALKKARQGEGHVRPGQARLRNARARALRACGLPYIDPVFKLADTMHNESIPFAAV